MDVSKNVEIRIDNCRDWRPRHWKHAVQRSSESPGGDPEVL